MGQQDSVQPLPYFYVGKSITGQRITNYVNQKNNLLSESLGKPDTQSIWYSKDHITKLLEEIELAEGDGLRIYLGAYESTNEYAGQLCLLMVVTKARTGNDQPEHINVYLEDQPDFADRSALQRN